jgi:oligopeptide/dipeptide ABC transporter ATP-binding protein
MSQRIGVMYLGQLVEIGPSKVIVNEPQHPYTKALIGAVPEPDPKVKSGKRTLSGDVPSPIDRPPGCPFHPRCPIAIERCRVDIPRLRELNTEHMAACHLV